MNVGRYLRGEDRHVGSARTTKNEDPLDTPIPCDVKVGHVTIRKGVAFRTLVNRMQVLYDMAQPKAEQEPKREKFWQHNCPEEGQIGIEKGHACDWCGATEKGTK